MHKLFLEYYLDLYLALLLHLSGFVLDKGDKEFEELFFTKSIDQACTIMVIVLFVVGTIYPFWSHYAIRRDFKTLKPSRLAAKHSVLLEGSKIGTLSKALYTVYFLYRRMITCIVLVVLNAYPYF